MTFKNIIKIRRMQINYNIKINNNFKINKINKYINI
jgi:hypothetical protein